MRLLPLVPVLLLAACGSSPKTHFLTLVPIPSAHSPPTARLAARPVEIGQVELPAALDRLALVRQGPGARIEILDQDHWVAPLDELARHALTEDLRDRLGSTVVLAPGDPLPRDSRTLVVNVQEFSPDSAGRLVLTADWSVSRTNGPPRTRHGSVRVESRSSEAADLAMAMSEALGRLSDDIASDPSMPATSTTRAAVRGGEAKMRRSKGGENVDLAYDLFS